MIGYGYSFEFMVTVTDLESRAKETAKRAEMLGVEIGISPEDLGNGEVSLIVRKLRSGDVTYELLPTWLANWVVAAIPQNEPDVASAWLRPWSSSLTEPRHSIFKSGFDPNSYAVTA